jgi:hypothetical protein
MILSQKGSLPIIIGVVIMIVLAGGIGYYAATLNTAAPKPALNKTMNSQPQSEMSDNDQNIAPKDVALSDSNSDIPAGWSFKKSTGCGVYLPVPPKQAPYYIEADKTANYGIDAGGWWQLIEQAYSNPQDKFFTTEELITFENPENDNDDYVAGLVQVICGPNDKNYTTETFSDAYSKQFTDGTFGGLTFMKIGQMPMWGRSVTLALIQGGMYTDDTEYYFATPKQVFRIRAISNSTNKVINDTTQLILKNLQF